MKNKILDHFDLWIKMLLHHFDKHRIQGRIFFFEVGFSIFAWSIIVGWYTGTAIYDSILILTKCK